MQIYKRIYMYICMHIYIYIHPFVCVYIYIHSFVYIYIYICIHFISAHVFHWYVTIEEAIVKTCSMFYSIIKCDYLKRYLFFTIVSHLRTGLTWWPRW